LRTRPGYESTECSFNEQGGIPEIAAIHTTNGRWDIVAEMSCASLTAFDQALNLIRGIPGVRNSETSILLSSATT
jgi:DNA-binding Lrp family transcriptional regulator